MNDVSPTIRMTSHRIVGTLPAAAVTNNTDRHVDRLHNNNNINNNNNNINNNNNDFLFANILEDQTQRRDETK